MGSLTGKEGNGKINMERRGGEKEMGRLTGGERNGEIGREIWDGKIGRDRREWED